MAQAASNLLFILDASNSMWGQVEGIAKIETARKTLSRLLADLPANTRTGLMVYGHRDKSSCKDVEIVVPVGKTDPAAIKGQLSDITPRGKTPMAYSLEQSATAFDADSESANNVVLISDGIETCEGDPCAAAGKLAEAEIGVKVHVVGFDISKENRAQLECIAEKGRGRYFAADSTQGFSDAVTEAVQVAQTEAKVEPKPAEPARKQVFFDDFNGSGLSRDWTVHNPDTGAYIVEKSELLMLNTGQGGFGNPDTPNIVELGVALPDGDWDAHVTFTGEFKTNSNRFWFGLHKDKDNFLGAVFETGSHSCGLGSHAALKLVKRRNGEETSFKSDGMGKKYGCNQLDIDAWTDQLAGQSATITLSKRGRSYTATIRVPGPEGEQETYKTARLTSLRAPGNLAVATGKGAEVGGEVLVQIDSVEIETVKEP
jgi:hypothetical protein